MEFRLQFEGIRCFVEKQDAVIRPLTLLVGENSSGKTTLLALCQMLPSIISVAVNLSSTVSFNEPPFLLGAYDQIASYRGGRRGQAKSFYVALTLCRDGDPASLRVTFAERFGQPEFQSSRIRFGDVVLERTPAGFPGGDQHAATAYDLFLDLAFRWPYAFAPIRTSPQRTYDPVIVRPGPEGSHVPMQLSLMAHSRAGRGWSALQRHLGDFGSRSGLFRLIGVNRKGKKESDPFQITVKSSRGPAFNLVDVGYGVSQVLPILVDTLTISGNRGAVFLMQQPEVHLHPKAQAELGSFFARQTNGKRRFVIETHSDYLVDRVRMEVRRKTISPKDVSLLYFERHEHGSTIHNLELDKHGSIINPPPGYRQFFLDEERKLLDI